MNQLDLIAEDFELLGDWDQRYQYLVELGEGLAPMPASEKTNANRVMPCMSKVWVRAYQRPGNDDLIFFRGDCDTAVIKGVVALLVRIYSGKTVEKILSIDIDALFERIELAENLSPNRHVGVYAIVQVMQDQVREYRSG